MSETRTPEQRAADIALLDDDARDAFDRLREEQDQVLSDYSDRLEQQRENRIKETVDQYILSHRDVNKEVETRSGVRSPTQEEREGRARELAPRDVEEIDQEKLDTLKAQQLAEQDSFLDDAKLDLHQNAQDITGHDEPEM